MFTGPLQQLLMLGDNERRACREGEGERLCHIEAQPILKGKESLKDRVLATGLQPSLDRLLSRARTFLADPWAARRRKLPRQGRAGTVV
jgi:hypothetical protein